MGVVSIWSRLAARLRGYRSARTEANAALIEKLSQIKGALWDYERDQWAGAESLTDLGNVTARWLEGDIKYHPNGYDNGPDPETAGIIPALAALNRSGFVTNGSQPGEPPTWGYDGQVWQQRAAVEGFADKATANRIEAAAKNAGLIVIRHEGARRWRNYRSAVDATVSGDSVCTGFGTRLSRSDVELSFDGYLHDELCKAEQLVIIDPKWGRNDRLWSTLTGITPRKTETRYSLERYDNKQLQESYSDLTFEQVGELFKEHEDTGHSFKMTGWDSVEPEDEYLPHDYHEYGTPFHESELGPIPEASEWMRCPDCEGQGCETCAGDGQVPTWLKDPNVVGEHAARSWGWTGNPEPYDDGPTRALLNVSDRDERDAPLRWPTAQEWADAGVDEADRTYVHNPDDPNGLPAGFDNNDGGYSEDDEVNPDTSRPYFLDLISRIDEVSEHNNGGQAMTAPTAPTNTGSSTGSTGDVVTIGDLRALYERSAADMATMNEQLNAVATALREQATAYEAAVGGIASEHDEQTRAEASVAMEALIEAADKASETAVAGDVAEAAFQAGYQGLERHRALEEAVQSHAGPAPYTASYGGQ